MNDPEKTDQVCPACGYPLDAGHAWNCPIDKKKREDESPYSYDYSSVEGTDTERFIIPHIAEGPNVHEILVNGADIKMFVSFHIEDGEFYITGLQNNSANGVIISGNISRDSVRIKHIEVAKNLRSAGIGTTLLSDLEEQLEKEGIKKVYSTFYKPSTIEFFLKNGYEIIPLRSLDEEEQSRLDIDPEDFDSRVENEDSFNALKATEGNEFKKILMSKGLTK